MSIGGTNEIIHFVLTPVLTNDNRGCNRAAIRKET
jgi:hypothetical protein